jgi:hypothetical protein
VIDTGTVMLVAVAAVDAPAVTPALPNVTTELLLNEMKFPVIVTGTLDCPWWPLFGFTWVIVGVPGLTVNLAGAVAIWVPVCTTTARVPTAAVVSGLTWTVAVVGLVTVTIPACPSAPPATDTPALKLASVAPWTKFVSEPVMATWMVWPSWAELGRSEVMAGGESTVNETLLLTKTVPVAVVPETERR